MDIFYDDHNLVALVTNVDNVYFGHFDCLIANLQDMGVYLTCGWFANKMTL